MIDTIVSRVEIGGHGRIRRQVGRRQLEVEDVLAETERRLAEAKVRSVDDVRGAKRSMVAFSPAMLAELGGLRRFLFERMYRHYRVNRIRSQARRILAEMFDLFVAEPDILPPEWAARARTDDPVRRGRAVCDYIAGMTDRFAIEEHRRLFNLDSALDL